MNKDELRALLRDNLKRDALHYFGRSNNEWLEKVTDAWLNDQSNSQWRWEEIERYNGKSLTEKTRVLDMACGCGTFVFYGLLKRFDVWGIDPEDWKLQFIKTKNDVYGYPDNWKYRFVKGVGEALPFPDAHFDFVSSYQTLEHVQNVENCLQEMIRVLKPGGAAFLKAPDYRSTFEGHYRIPWLPLMPRSIARIYLKILGKPDRGLSTINYVTFGKLKKYLQNNPSIELIIDHNKANFFYRLDNRFNPPKAIENLLYTGYKLKKTLSGLFRHEFSINIIAVKK